MKEEWKRKRIKDFAILNPSPANCNMKGDVSFVPMECLRTGYIEKRIIDYQTGRSKYTFFEENDLLIAKVTPCFENGNIAIAENLEQRTGFGSSEIFVYRFNKEVYNKYMFYVLQSAQFKNSAIATMCGVGGLKRISPLFMRTFSVSLPDISTQINIANYLNKKIAQIAARIALLEKKRDIYNRLKKNLINKIVTRGLRLNTDLKYSHVNWMGEIPIHWKVMRAKSLFSESKMVSHTGKEDLLSVSEYYGIARRADKMTDDDEYETRSVSLIGYKICKKGDLVINIMLAWKKGLGVSDFDGIVSPAYAVYRPLDIYSRYYHYLLRTDMYMAEFKRNSKGIIDSRLRLYTERFYNILLPVPPLSEQQEIANYLDSESVKIDKIVSNIDVQITKLQTLRKSLINEVVTGERSIV